MLLAAILLAARSAVACPAPDPAAMTRWIFTKHFDFYVVGKGGPSYLSPRLLSLLQKDWKCQEPGDVCAIDSVPWTDSQDGDVIGPIRYRVVSNDGRTAIVEMSYEFGTKHDHVSRSTRVTLVKSAGSGCWLLDDMTTGTSESLRQSLEEFDYPKR